MLTGVALPNLTRDQAAERAALITVDSYRVALDLTDGAGSPSEKTFRSVTTVEFDALAGADTYLDLAADSIRSATLNGADIDVSGYDESTGIPLTGLAGHNVVVVDADTPGFEIVERIPLMAPHPLATIRFTDCRIDGDRLLGAPAEGFRIAMATLDVFRSTVAAAALGFSRRAFDEAASRTVARQLVGAPMSDLQLVQASLADMALKIDASALLIYRAAWLKDQGAPRVTREAAMAKLYATDEAQAVIDAAVQLFGGLGVVSGNPVERLYREIRALRIYEGASEVQKIVIARQVLAGLPGAV